MKIAVISDTHDHRENILKAISIMNERDVDALIHCGDIVAPFVKKWFDGLNSKIKENFYGVFGNNDGEITHLRRVLGQICKFAENGLEHILTIGGKKIFASHFPKPETIEALANSGNFDMVLSGHTHNIVNEKKKMESLLLIQGKHVDI